MTEKKQMEDDREKPLLIYDGECQFCVRCIEKLKHDIGEVIEYSPLQDKEKRPASVSEKDYEQAVHLFIPGEDSPIRGAEAICRALAIGKKPVLLALYQKMPLFARMSEAIYGMVAKRRSSISFCAKILWGKSLLPDTYRFSCWLFGRGLGLVALIAFVSYWSQANGLVGDEGIMPFHDQLENARNISQNNPEAPTKEWILPTLLWLAPDGESLTLLFGFGVTFSLLLMVGVLPALSVAGIWVCYLSVMVVGSPFLHFQWDNLLMETCLLSVFFLPWKVFAGPRSTPAPSHLGRLLILLLLFKLMFESGIVKFTYFGPGDTNAWSDFTALEYHYWTQPIPAWTSWYFDRLPDFLDKISLWFMYTAELVLPFFFFLPRNARRLAFAGQILLQCAIMASGNYGFFNLLSVVLCLPLLDDQILPRRLRHWISNNQAQVAEMAWAKRLRLAGLVPLGILVPYLGSIYLKKDFEGNRPSPGEVSDEPSAWRLNILQKARQTRSLNSYGLFRVMTTTRPELIVEASMDGETWKPYEFKWKPGDLEKAPEFFIPHMPRLDWQMWFEALNAENYAQHSLSQFLYGRFLTVIANGGTRDSFMHLDTALGSNAISELQRMNSIQRQQFLRTYDSMISSYLQRSLWFAEFLERLANAEPSVLELLDKVPYHEKKPRFLRVTLWQYNFSSPDQKEEGAWWSRQKVEGFDTAIEIRAPK